MRTIELMDYIQRIINSLLFRLVIVIYALTIIVINENYFSLYFYIVAIILYCIAYLLLIRTPNKNDKIRLINDFVFINIILFNKDPLFYINYTFLTLHLINNINFSGKSKSYLPYLLITITLFFNIYVFKTNSNSYISIFYFKAIIPFIFILLISYYTSHRMKAKFLSEKLNYVVDDFYINFEQIKKPHKIYKSIISVIHNDLKKKIIEDIVCFTKLDNSNKLSIVNGSRFIWNIDYKDENIYDEISKKKYIQNVKIEIDGETKNFNFLMYSKIKNTEYFYLFILKNHLPFYLIIIQFFRSFESVLNKISRILLSEKMLTEIRKVEVEKLSDKILYVNKASKTMHFVRNRLGPFSNLLMMIENFKTVPLEKIEEYRQLIYSENDRAKNDLKLITNRANEMLEKTNNPFVFINLDTISIQKVFTIFKRNVNSFFPGKEIDLRIHTLQGKQFVELNEEGFEIFLSDWINNMSKYHINVTKFIFELFDNKIRISFINDHNQTTEEVKKLIKDLKTDIRKEIMMRTTHGLYLIKSALDDMNIEYNAEFIETENLIKFEIIIKIIENENSSI